MRVQRAPRAAAQPQAAPADWSPRRLPVAVPPPGAETAVLPQGGFRAEVELDLTDVRRAARDDDEVIAHVVVALLAACRSHHLLDDTTRCQVLTPTRAGWIGASFEQATRQSVFGIATGLAQATEVVPDADRSTLRLVRLDSSAVRSAGDWGLVGLGTGTIGAATPVAMPWAQGTGPGFSIATRWTARVGLALAHSSEGARAVVAALDEAEREVRGLGPSR